MAEEFGRPYTNNRMYKTLPLNSAVQLWRDFSTIPFELVFIEKGVYCTTWALISSTGWTRLERLAACRAGLCCCGASN